MRKFISSGVVAGLLSIITIHLNAQITLFSDNLENGATGWTVEGSSDGVSNDGGLWHLSQRWSASTNTSWYFGQESTGTITNGWSYGSITTPSINLTSVTNAVLTYAHLTRGDACLPIDDDYVAVFVSTNNFETFSVVLEGLPNGWSLWGGAGSYEGPTVTVDLSEFAGHTVNIQFYVSFNQACGEHLDTSECPPTEGYYIDDISVVGNTVIPAP